MTCWSVQPESGWRGKLFGTERFYALASLRILGMLLLLGMSSGCHSKAPSAAPTANPVTADIIRIACPQEPAASLLKRYGRRWTSKNALQLEIVVYPPDQDPDAAGATDLWVIEPARMPHYAARGGLFEVPAELRASGRNFAWDSLLPLWRNKLLIWDEKAFALPLLEEPLFCYYRRDLIEDPGQGEAFHRKHRRELKPPELWEDFVEIAEFFNNQERPGVARPCASLPPLPVDERLLDWEYYCLAAPFARLAAREDAPHLSGDSASLSFHYDLQAGAVRINTPGFVHALEMMQRIQKCRAPGHSAEPPVAFQRGEAVLCLAGPSWIARFNENKDLRGKFGFRTIPGSRVVFDFKTGAPIDSVSINYVPYLGSGGAVAVVPRTSSHPMEAWAFAAFLSDPKTSRDIVIEPEWGGGAFRREHLENPVGWQGFNLGTRGAEALVDSIRRTVAYNQIKNPVVRLRIPQEESHRRALSKELRLALTQGKNARQALDDAAQCWRELDSVTSLSERISDYRLSLGLTRSN